ncbi:MAG TPA: septation protein IspZ [Rhizomicrobium sp.]|jgi:intracellular septation protein A|nr:septation protein IspZ [Rhizomicrobium sp.]
MGFLQAFRPILLDMLATIVFIVILKVTGNVVIATLFGIAAGLARFVWLKIKRLPVGPLQYVSVALVIVMGSATIFTDNPLFMELKPSLAGLAVAGVMLSTNWLAPYLPPIVTDNLEPAIIRWTGRLWGLLQLVLAIANAAIAFKEPAWWPAFAAFVPGISNVAAFVLHFSVFRFLIRRRMQARAAQAQAAA